MDKCTRCGRTLKKSYLIDGVPYGPVCVRKMGGSITSDGVARLPHKPKTKKESDQLEVFALPDSGVSYMGAIVGQDTDRYLWVTRRGRTSFIPLELSLEYVKHSPTGFCWGYAGSGPAQLAFAILLDFLNGDVERVRGTYMDFKFRVIAALPMDKDFQITGQQIESALSVIDAERLARL